MDEVPWLKHGFILMSALAGAITSVGFQKKGLSWKEAAMAIFVGFTFSVFVTPLLAEWLFGIEADTNARTLAGMVFLTAAANHILLPKIFERWGSDKKGLTDD